MADLDQKVRELNDKLVTNRISIPEALREMSAHSFREAADKLWHGPGCPEFKGGKGKRMDDRLYAVKELRRLAESVENGGKS